MTTRIYLLFLRPIVRTGVGFFFALLAVHWISGRLGFRILHTGVVLLIVSIILPAAFSNHHVPKNLGWLLNLPLSRTKLLLLNFWINITVFIGSLGTALFATVTFSSLRHGPKLTWVLLKEPFVSEVSPREITTATEVAVALLVIFIVPGVAFLLKKPRTVAYQPIHPPHPEQILRLSAAPAAFLAVIYLLREPFSAPFAVTSIIFSCLTLAIAASNSNALSLSPRRTKKAYVYAGILSLVFTLNGFMIGYEDLHSNNPKMVAAAVEYLGTFSGKIAPEKLRAILAEDLSTKEIRSLGARAQEAFANKKPFHPRDPHFPFEQLITTQKTSAATIAIAELYDFAMFTSSDVRRLLHHLSEVKKRDEANYVVFHFVRHDFTDSEFVALIDSQNELENLLGLIRARYFRSEQLIQPIIHNLRRYSDSLKVSALLTLSILRGTRISLDAIPALAKTTEFKLKPVNCSGLDWRNLMKHISDQASSNVCLRQRLKTSPGGYIQWLEGFRWIDQPFSYDEIECFRRMQPKE